MTLDEFMELVVAVAQQSGHAFSEDFADQLAEQITRARPGERVYIPEALCKKAAIQAAAKRLPADVVAERYGVTRRWVNKISRR